MMRSPTTFSPILIAHSICTLLSPSLFFFFFNDTATTEIYTLSLHDALPISFQVRQFTPGASVALRANEDYALGRPRIDEIEVDRKSTRLNSSHQIISYAVFCLKKKKKKRH